MGQSLLFFWHLCAQVQNLLQLDQVHTGEPHPPHIPQAHLGAEEVCRVGAFWPMALSLARFQMNKCLKRLETLNINSLD